MLVKADLIAGRKRSVEKSVPVNQMSTVNFVKKLVTDIFEILHQTLGHEILKNSSSGCSLATAIQIMLTSSVKNQGIESVRDVILMGMAAVFVGASGVGKFMLVNRLLGQEVVKTSAVRENDKGRNTTAHREFI